MFTASLRRVPAPPAACGAPPARPHAAIVLRNVASHPVASKMRLTMAQAAMDTEQPLVSYSDAEKMPAFVDGRINKFPMQSGVFAVYDNADVLRFVGISRNISLSITEHAKSLGDRVHSVKAAVIPNATKEALTTAWKEWLQAAVCTTTRLPCSILCWSTRSPVCCWRLRGCFQTTLWLLLLQVNETGSIPPGNGDAEEKRLWQTRRKPKAKPEIRLTPGKGVEDLKVDIKELIGMVVKSEKVVAFIKGTRTEPQCGFSYQLLTTLNSMNTEYQVVNCLDELYNPGLREAIKEFSQWPTIPQLYVKGEFVGGGDIVQQMAADGELAKLLNE